MEKNDTLVAINLTNGTKLLNPTKRPILFYWDGTGDLHNDIIGSEELVKILKDNCFTYEDYIKICIDYFKFDYIDDEEVYKEETIPLCSFVQLSDLPDIIWISEVQPHFNYLYNCSFKEDYVFTENLLNDFKDIYNKLKEKYPDKISETTVLNYIRSKFETYIGEQDKEYMIQKTLETIQ